MARNNMGNVSGLPTTDGWDTTILTAPASHKSEMRVQQRHRRRRSAVGGFFKAIGIILCVAIGLAAAVALGLLIALLRTGTLPL